MPTRPVFLLVFTFDKANVLPKVRDELEQIIIELSKNEAQIVPLWKATQADFEEKLAEHRDAIRLIHFAGHAGPNGLEFNSADGGAARLSFADGLAGLVGGAKNLRLLFLNGCATERQAEAFFGYEIPAVIATTKPLSDSFGLEFARRFYENFAQEKRRFSLNHAFQAAFYSFNAANGPLSKAILDPKRDSGFEVDEDANEPLYTLRIHEKKPAVGNEKLIDWLTEPDPKPDWKAEKTEIQNLVAAARLETAFKKLVELTEKTERDDLKNSAVLLKSQFASVERENLMGLISFSDKNMRTAQITNGLLHILNQF